MRKIDALVEKREEICSYLKSKSMSLVYVLPWWELKYFEYSADDVSPDFFERETLEDMYRTEFCYVVNSDTLSKRKMLDEVRDALLELKDAVSKMGLSPQIEEKIEEEETPPEEE